MLAVLAAAALWGTTGTAATFAPGVGPLAMGAAALGIGGLLQAVIAAPALAKEHAAVRARSGTVLAGALAVAVYPLAFYSSMHLAGVAVGTVVSLGSAPLASGLLERVVDGRPLDRRWMIAAALGIAGSAVLCGAKMRGTPDAALPTIAGVGVGLVAGFTYALYSWCVHRLLVRGVGRAAAMGSVFGAGGLALMPVLVLTGAPLLATAQSAAVGTYMALVPLFLGYVLFGMGLTRIPASTATTLTLAEPAIAATLAVLVVGERLPALGWAGLAGIGASLALLALSPGGHQENGTHRWPEAHTESAPGPTIPAPGA